MKYQPLKYVWNDNWGLMASHTNGNIMVFLFFLTIGIGILMFAKFAQNKLEAQLIAWCFILCAISRIFIALCVWYDMYVLSAIITNATGLMSMVSTFFLIRVFRAIGKIKTLAELQKTQERVEQKVETLKELKNENDGISLDK